MKNGRGFLKWGYNRKSDMCGWLAHIYEGALILGGFIDGFESTLYLAHGFS
jgi:hypothetical protein